MNIGMSLEFLHQANVFGAQLFQNECSSQTFVIDITVSDRWQHAV